MGFLVGFFVVIGLIILVSLTAIFVVTLLNFRKCVKRPAYVKQIDVERTTSSEDGSEYDLHLPVIAFQDEAGKDWTIKLRGDMYDFDHSKYFTIGAKATVVYPPDDFSKAKLLDYRHLTKAFLKFFLMGVFMLILAYYLKDY